MINKILIYIYLVLQLFRAREEKRSAAPHIISGFNYFVATYNSLTCTVNSNNIHLYLFLQNRDHNKNHNDGNNSDDEEKKDDSPYKVRSSM